MVMKRKKYCDEKNKHSPAAFISRTEFRFDTWLMDLNDS